MTTKAATAGQVSNSAAEIYDEFFVPSLFGAWAGPLCDLAGITPGSHVLDVACGTGATTREAARRNGPSGRTVGLDRNGGMLAVAKSRSADIEWIEGFAEALPFAGNTFDTVLCQFGLMFFDNRSKALTQMMHVLRPGGRVAFTVWDDVENSPGYVEMVELIDSMFGKDAGNALRAPYVLGDRQTLQGVLDEGGLTRAIVQTVTGEARFASVREWVRMDVRGWTLSDDIDDAGFEALVAAAEDRFGRFRGQDGKVVFPAPAHLIVGVAE